MTSRPNRPQQSSGNNPGFDAVSYREIDKDLVVTVFHPEDGIAAATVGYAGELYCVNGMNAEAFSRKRNPLGYTSKYS